MQQIVKEKDIILNQNCFVKNRTFSKDVSTPNYSEQP